MKNKQVKMRLIDGLDEIVVRADEDVRIVCSAEPTSKSEECRLGRERNGNRIAASSPVFRNDPAISELAYDPTADQPAQEDFVQEERKYRAGYVFTLADVGEKRGYLDLVDFATSVTCVEETGPLGPRIDYHGRVKRVLEVELILSGVPEEHIGKITEGLRLAYEKSERVVQLASVFETLRSALSEDQAIRFLKGREAHVDESPIDNTALEELIAGYSQYESLEPVSNRALEPRDRKSSGYRR